MIYNAGFQTVASLASAKPGEVETVLRNAVPFVSERKHLGETDKEVRHRSEARVFWVAGKRGLSEREAAVLIVTEAKELLRGDVAQLGIQWQAPEVPTPEVPTPEVPTPEVSLSKVSVNSKANHKIGSRSSRNAIGTSVKKGRHRRSSGSNRKSQSPPLRHCGQKSPPHLVSLPVVSRDSSSKASGSGFVRTVTVPDTVNRLQEYEFKKPAPQKCLKNPVEIEAKTRDNEKFNEEELKIGKKYPTTKGKTMQIKDSNRSNVQNDKQITTNENQDIKSRDMQPTNQEHCR